MVLFCYQWITSFSLSCSMWRIEGGLRVRCGLEYSAVQWVCSVYVWLKEEQENRREEESGGVGRRERGH